MLTVNGTDLSELLTVNDIRGRSITDRELSLISTPGSDGARLHAVRIPVRPLEVDVTIKAESPEQLRKKIDDINAIILTEEVAEIQFSDESDRYYYGIASSVSESLEAVSIHQTTITFTRLDPYKYSAELKRDFITSIGTIKNEGSAPAKPIIELDVKEDLTYAVVQNDSDRIKLGGEEYPKYMMLGRPHEVDETPFNRYVTRFHANGSNLVGWTTASNSDIDGGIVAGEITTRGGRFVADSYGEGSNWHGPALKTSLSTPISDFRLSAFVGFLNQSSGNMVGRLEIYLLDVNGNSICKMALKDTSANRAAVFTEMRAGDRDANDMIISGFPNNETGWNNFSGQLRISREWDDVRQENVWSAYVALVDTSTGRHHGRRMVSEWRDGGQHNRQVAQIVMHLGTVGNHAPIHENSGISSIVLQEIMKEPEGVPIIANAGDKIEIDSTDKTVYLNGEPRNDLIDFGSDFWNLVLGENRIVTHPDGFDTSIRYRNRYK